LSPLSPQFARLIFFTLRCAVSPARQSNEEAVEASLVVSVGAAVSDRYFVQLMQKPVHTALGSAGMLVEMIESPRYPSDEFTVSVYANTNGNSLSTWSVQLEWSSVALQYGNYFSVASLYNTPTVTSTATSITMTVTGESSGVTPAQITGAKLLLATFRFRVKAAASAGPYRDALTARALTMVNKDSLEYVSKKAAQMNDGQGGAQAGGRVVVQKHTVRGLFSYGKTHELFNTAYLNGVAATTAITTKAVFSRYTLADQVITSSADCTLPLDAQTTARVSSCVLTTDKTHTTGGYIAVQTFYSGFTSSLNFKVWFPKIVRVYAQDDVLNLITSGPTDFSGFANPRACGSAKMFQWTELMAIATFGGVGLVNVPDVEVTRLMAFGSTNTSNVVAEQNFAYGRASVKTQPRAYDPNYVEYQVAAQVFISGGHADLQAIGLDIVVRTDPRILSPSSRWILRW
jgi:hypothetical protein